MRCLSACVVLFLAGVAPAGGPERVVFPADAHVLDVRQLDARGDGVADDTEALQKGIDLSSGYQQKTTKVLYLPNGTYKVTKTLVVRNALGPWLYGESRDGVVIKLADGSKGVTCVLRTHPNEAGKTSADWFMRNLRNFTIDAGDNPDADGVRYYATNSGMLQNVRVVGNGKVGINAGFLDQSGPNLVQDCAVEGFETGVLSQWIWGQTLSRVTVKNCRKVGLVVSANSVAVEDLRVENTPLAVHVQEPNGWGHWAGVVALVGGTFRGGDPAGPAVRNDGVLYARGVTTSGFKSAVAGKKPADGPNLDEYASHPAKSLFPPSQATPHLPVKPEPAVGWEADPAKWLCANDFGAVAGDNKDDTAAVQKAIDAAAKEGKTTVYFRGCGGYDPNWYTVDGEVRVHGSVRQVMGLGWARILGGKAGRFVVSDESAPVVKFQNIDSFGGPPVALVNRSARTLVAESCGVRVVGEGAGDVFVTDCPAGVELTKPGQKAWCRQLDPEGDSDAGLVRNAGGDLWILGMKCEGRGVRVATSDGGRTEVFGSFIYGPGIANGDRRPLFDVRDGSLRVMGLRELAFGGACYRTKVVEARGGEKRVLDDKAEGGWIGWADFNGWSAAK